MNTSSFVERARLVKRVSLREAAAAKIARTLLYKRSRAVMRKQYLVLARKVVLEKFSVETTLDKMEAVFYGTVRG
jgi:transcriptional regulator GlxA family with amidase domain